MSTQTVRLIRGVEKGGGMEVGEEVGFFTCPYRYTVTKQYPQTTSFEEKGQPKLIRTKVPLLTSLTPLPLGQTGSYV